MSVSKRCFVRVWHEKIECRRTSHPILVVHYRLAFEGFSGVHQGLYDLVFYNGYARERIVSVGMYQGHMILALHPEPFLGPEAKDQLSRHTSCHVAGLKQVVGLEVRLHPPHSVVAVTVSVAYALRLQQPFRRLNPLWKGESEEWIQTVQFLDNDLLHLSETRQALDLLSGAVHVLLEFKPRLFRCQGLHG